MIATSAFFAIFSSFIPGHSDRDGNTFGYHTNVWVCVVLSGIDTKSNKKEENCEKIILLNKILSSHTSESNQQSSNLRFTSLGHFKSNLCKNSNCRYFFFLHHFDSKIVLCIKVSVSEDCMYLVMETGIISSVVLP